MSRAYETELEDELELEDEDEAIGGLNGTSLLREDEFEGARELEDEYEAEDELEGEFEDEFESELESEFEDEFEDEFEVEGEGEWEDEAEDEAFLGGLAQLAGSILGEGEDEWEGESEEEYFFGKIGRFVKRNSGFLKKIAKVAGPLIATAVGGPAAGAVARAVTSQLEGEFEEELEAELEELASSPLTPAQAYAEYLAAKAAASESESEAEALAGSAVTLSLSARDKRRLDDMLPHLIRGTSVLTRVLYRNPRSRQAVRLVPSIVGSAARTLSSNAAHGTLRRADVGAVLSGSTRRVLSDPRWRTGAVRRHARGLAYRHRRRQLAGRPQQRRRGVGRGYRSTLSRSTTISRRPIRVRNVSRSARVTRPPAGVLRLITPLHIPGRDGQGSRTVRVITDVKVPRGAVPTGRPASVTSTRR